VWGGDGRIHFSTKVMGQTRPAPWSFSYLLGQRCREAKGVRAGIAHFKPAIVS